MVRQLLDRRRDPLQRLTPREREALALMTEGRTNAAIARELYVTEAAVNKHVGAGLTRRGPPLPEAEDRACGENCAVRAVGLSSSRIDNSTIRPINHLYRPWPEFFHLSKTVRRSRKRISYLRNMPTAGSDDSARPRIAEIIPSKELAPR